MSNPDSGAAKSAPTWILVVWPAFLAACLLEALVFSLVDPRDIHWVGNSWLPARQALYSIAFFSFWAITMLCSSMVLWLAGPYRAFSSDRIYET